MSETGDKNFDLRNTCRSAEWMLKDYFRKLERDDFDSSAVEKMKAVKIVLKQLEMMEQDSNTGRLIYAE